MEGQSECVSMSAHPWGAVDLRRKVWAQSRESCQASGSQGEGNEGGFFPEDTGRIPSKIASWLKDCKTPIGTSLDEPTNDFTRNGCSFEDDLSLGAEANHLQSRAVKAEAPRVWVQEKRNLFQQKAHSINSTGSARSSTTVSNVSELLDLYEEDPEEILYNLGFGTDEPDIATKVPPRFFSTSSCAKGIDMKVYLGAQLKRMEMENPSYALTSRFRQIKVLTTVANAFGVLYSQVSGLPVQKLRGAKGYEGAVETAHLRSHNSALNAAKMLKSLTRHSLHPLPLVPAAPPTKAPLVEDGPLEPSHESRQQKQTPSSLVTVMKEVGLDGEQPIFNTKLQFAHLLQHNRDSFEMEEVQSIEGDMHPVSHSTRLAGSDLLRTPSQNSDSSGFSEDPPFNGINSMLTVQESLESCDSRTTVTEVPLGLPQPAIQELLHKDMPIRDPSGQGQNNSASCVVGPPEFSQDLIHSPTESGASRSDGPVAATETGPCDASESTDGPGSKHQLFRTVGTELSPPQPVQLVEQPNITVATSVCLVQPGVLGRGRVWVKPQDLILHGGMQMPRSYVRRFCSMTPSLLNPTHVVSSIRVQFHAGAPHHCSPPAFSYHYSPEEKEDQSSCCSVPLLNQPTVLNPGVTSVSKEAKITHERSQPQNLHAHLTHSCCSLCSTPPPNWPPQALGESSRPWSSSHILGPQCRSAHIQLNQPCSCHTDSPAVPTAKVPSCGASLNYGPHSAPYGLGLHSAPYGLPNCNHYGIPHGLSCTSLHSAPYSSSWNNLQSIFPPDHQPWNPRMIRPSASQPSIEMQLTQVLQEIRGSMQNLAQVCRGDAAQRTMTSLNEVQVQDLQNHRRDLQVFRSQMLELELALVQQQHLVYQHLNPEQRQEAAQLHWLRGSVRQELQELELRLEDHLLCLDKQLRTSVCHHPVVSELLREQCLLKAELDSSDGATADPHPMKPHTSPSQPAVFRASISVTLATPPRPDHNTTMDGAPNGLLGAAEDNLQHEAAEPAAGQLHH